MGPTLVQTRSISARSICCGVSGFAFRARRSATAIRGSPGFRVSACLRWAIPLSRSPARTSMAPSSRRAYQFVGSRSAARVKAASAPFSSSLRTAIVPATRSARAVSGLRSRAVARCDAAASGSLGQPFAALSMYRAAVHGSASDEIAATAPIIAVATSAMRTVRRGRSGSSVRAVVVARSVRLEASPIHAKTGIVIAAKVQSQSPELCRAK